jgi:hypothetical protein
MRRQKKISEISKFSSSTTITAMEAALDALQLQEAPNYAQTARQHGVNEITLARHFKGEQQSRKEADYQYKTALTKQQEKTLIAYINKLTQRGLPPTPHMVKSWAENLCKRELGKNWHSDWIKRHSAELASDFLKGEDLNRKRADNLERYQFYFSQVIFYILAYRF